MVGNSVRYSDDGCDGVAPDSQPWADVVAAHGNEVVTCLFVTQGFSMSTDSSALVRQVTVNGTTFAFNVPPASGAAGAPGTTRIIQMQAPTGARPTGSGVLGTQASSCKGDDLLTLRAVRRARPLSVRATLRGKHLKVNGRAITLDLRNRTEGNYDVRIVQRYRAKSGRVATSITHRVRSVACA